MRRAAALLGLVALAGCGSRPGPQRTPGPVAAPGVSVPATIGRSQGGAVALVPVRVGGRRLVFLLDTGASQSSIDIRAARRAGLGAAGHRQRQTTVGCTTSAQPVRIARWSVGALRLPATTALAQRTDLYDRSRGKVVGLLGSDVLGRLHRLTVDYRHGRVTFGGPAPSGGRAFRARVVHMAGGTVVGVRATVHGRALAYLVDTGAGSSTIDSRVARPLGLRSAGPRRTISAVNCPAVVQPLRLDDWSVGGIRLPAVAASAQRSDLLDSQRIAGLMGGDVFARFGQVSIDFGSGRVTLGDDPHHERH